MKTIGFYSCPDCGRHDVKVLGEDADSMVFVERCSNDEETVRGKMIPKVKLTAFTLVPTP